MSKGRTENFLLDDAFQRLLPAERNIIGEYAINKLEDMMSAFDGDNKEQKLEAHTLNKQEGIDWWDKHEHTTGW